MKEGAETWQEVDRFLDDKTPPGIVADWLEDRGFPYQDVLDNLRAGVTREDVEKAVHAASPNDAPTRLYISNPQSFDKISSVSWNRGNYKGFPDGDWWYVNFFVRTTGKTEERFVIEHASYLRLPREDRIGGRYPLRSAARALTELHFPKEEVIKLGILMWGYLQTVRGVTTWPS